MLSMRLPNLGSARSRWISGRLESGDGLRTPSSRLPNPIPVYYLPASKRLEGMDVPEEPAGQLQSRKKPSSALLIDVIEVGLA